MGWGNSTNVTTTHLNSSSDDPSQARVEIYNAFLELQAVINGRNAANGVAGLDASTKISNSYLPNTIISDVGVDLTLDPGTGRVIIEDLLKLTPKTVSELEVQVATEGEIAYCSNGDAGAGCLAVTRGETDSNLNTIWYRVTLGTQISAT